MNRQQLAAKHQQAHLKSINILKREPYCLRCYPITKRDKTTAEFRRFWDWISELNPGNLYTNYTLTSFEAYLTAFRADPATGGTLTVTTSRLADNLVSSLLLDFSDDDAIELIINITALTEGFTSKPTSEQTESVKQRIEPKTPAITMTKTDNKGKSSGEKAPSVKGEEPIITDDGDQLMNEGEDTPQASTQRLVHEVLMHVLGREGLDIANLLGGNRPQQAKELSLVKVDPFYGKEEEDPFEWIEMFRNAAVSVRN
jgi:hypothetical protein